MFTFRGSLNVQAGCCSKGMMLQLFEKYAVSDSILKGVVELSSALADIKHKGVRPKTFGDQPVSPHDYQTAPQRSSALFACRRRASS